MARKRTMKLYHGTRVDRAESIIQSGFDLSLIKPRWVNDYAVSTMTSPTAVRRFFGDRPNMVVLEMTFRGNVIDIGESRAITEGSRDPKDYQRRILDAGVDAVTLDGSPRQVFVYNPSTLSDIHLWAKEAPSARTAYQPHSWSTTMSRTLTASDRSALIRLASTMPSGSPERRAILASLWPASIWPVTDRSVVDPDVNAQVSVQDVDKVLSALITGPGWDPGEVQMIEREALNLAKQGYGRAVLMGILEWINNEDAPTPGMAHAYQVIAGIGRRIGQPIKPYGREESGIIVRLLNAAYLA